MRIRAFSLIECLVVLAIIGVIASILLPALASAKDRAHDTSDISALAQLGHAYALYESDYGSYPRHLEQVLASASLPDALLFSIHDRYPKGEASELTGSTTRRISYIGPCDYPVLGRGGAKIPSLCLATPEELLGLPAGGPLVFLGVDRTAPLRAPGARGASARYLRLTFAGGVVSRVTREYPAMPGQAVSSSGWAEWPQQRFYDEAGSPYDTFYGLRHPGR